MSFLDSLNRLQNSPLHKRKFAASIAITIIMAMVIGLWILQLKARSQISENDSDVSFAEPFRIVFDAFKEKLSGK